MKGAATPTTLHSRGRPFRQMLVGLIALPLSIGPFLAYGIFTPEGRILRDRLVVAISEPKLPELSPVQLAEATAGAPRYQGKVMALVYHGVGSTSDAEGGFVVSPRRFGEHLAMLRAAGMAAVTAAEVARAFSGGAPLPDNAVLITFDDGRADALLFADPLLEQAGMRATMFLISSATDRPNLYYADWSRIERAARSGRWDIEAHTHDSHRLEPAEGGESLPILTSLQPGESLAEYRARVRDDLDHNSEAIEDHIGHRPVAFAYPFGAYGADRANDPAIRDILREEVSARYPIAFHQDEQESVPLLEPSHDRHGLRRLEVGDWSGAELLGRIRQAAGGASAAPPPAVPGAPAEAPEPPPEAGVYELTAPTITTSPKRPVRINPARPATTSTTVGSPRFVDEPATTTSTGPQFTMPTQPPSSTTTSPSSSTSTSTTAATRPPPTTTTTEPPTTTTTRPSDTTTTTATKPCRGKGQGQDRCRR